MTSIHCKESLSSSTFSLQTSHHSLELFEHYCPSSYLNPVSNFLVQGYNLNPKLLPFGDKYDYSSSLAVNLFLFLFKKWTTVNHDPSDNKWFSYLTKYSLEKQIWLWDISNQIWTHLINLQRTPPKKVIHQKCDTPFLKDSDFRTTKLISVGSKYGR